MLSNSEPLPGNGSGNSLATRKLGLGFGKRLLNFPGLPVVESIIPRIIQTLRLVHVASMPPRTAISMPSHDAQNPRTIADAGACNRTN